MSGVCILGGQPDYPGHKVSSTGVGNSILVGPEGSVGGKEGAQGTPGSPELAMSQDKILERAQSSGVINLSSRGLKHYPAAAGKYKLKDTVVAGKTELFYTYLSMYFRKYVSKMVPRNLSSKGIERKYGMKLFFL